MRHSQSNLPGLATALAAALLLGCGDDASSADAAVSVDGASPPDATIPDEPDANLPVFDCATIPDTIPDPTVIPGARGWDGLVITDDGYMIGSDGSDLIRSNRAGDDVSVHAANVSDGHQLALLPDGVIAMSTEPLDGALTLVYPSGSKDILVANSYPYGVVVGPDGWVWYNQNPSGTNQPGGDREETLIARVHPTTREVDIVLQGGTAAAVRSINFSPDNKRLYMGTGDREEPYTGGQIFYADLDDDLNLGPIKTLTTDLGVVPGHSWHDTLAVDACGNLYTTDYYTRAVTRVSPTGEQTVLHVADSQIEYTHGIVWGTGEHGWDEHSMYLPRPGYGVVPASVIEMDVGVPGRLFKGIVVNAPPMAP